MDQARLVSPLPRSGHQVRAPHTVGAGSSAQGGQGRGQRAASHAEPPDPPFFLLVLQCFRQFRARIHFSGHGALTFQVSLLAEGHLSDTIVISLALPMPLLASMIPRELLRIV
jgi:hypothetical protein